jgi:hypothetical protein
MMGIGTPYREGRPKVIENGKVIDEGQPAQAAQAGNLAAVKYWQQNCDDLKDWHDTKDYSIATESRQILNINGMSEEQLVEFIVTGIQKDMKRKLNRIESRSPKVGAAKIEDAQFTEIKGGENA